ncbi:MAG: hypothetical protein K8R52_00675 [Bacteroidales bacterium]|nr:hypothetical protein [Bacteroidales bacterium]
MHSSIPSASPASSIMSVGSEPPSRNVMGPSSIVPEPISRSISTTGSPPGR